MKLADNLVRELAAFSPFHYVPSGVQCVFCSAKASTWEQVHHDGLCLWRRACAYCDFDPKRAKRRRMPATEAEHYERGKDNTGCDK